MILFDVAYAGVISDAPSIAQILLNILNFLLQVFGIFAIISLTVCGIMFLLSAGDEEMIKKAKAGATYSAIGIAVALGGMIIVKTISSFLEK